MLVLVAYPAWHCGSASRRIIEAERLGVVSNLTHLIDREIKATSGLLTGIAMSPGLQSGNPETQHRVTNVVLDAGFVELGVFDPSNRLVFSGPPTIRPAFADPGAVGVAAILGGQEFHVSNLVTVGDAKLFLVSVPIMVKGKIALAERRAAGARRPSSASWRRRRWSRRAREPPRPDFSMPCRATAST